MNTLKLALIHFDVRHRQAGANQRELLKLIRRAAAGGAELILTPEMAVSGYSFESRDDIAPHVEQPDGAFSTAVGKLAREYGI